MLHPGLLELELNHCRVGRIGSLEAAPALKRLELRDNGLTQIMGLEALSGLTSLDLQGNRIDKIGDSLALCSSLTYVDLSYNALSFKKPCVTAYSLLLRIDSDRPPSICLVWNNIAHLPLAHRRLRWFSGRRCRRSTSPR